MGVKLWVGGTTKVVSIPALADLVESYGSVVSIIKRTNYSFIELEDGASVQSAVQDLEGATVAEQPITVQLSSSDKYENAAWPSSAKVYVYVKVATEAADEVRGVMGEGFPEPPCHQPAYIRFECESREQAAHCVERINSQVTAPVKAFIGALTKLRPVDTPLPFPIKLGVRPQLVGAIIGHGGANISAIMEKSGAVVEVSSRQPRETERSVTVKGSQLKTVTAFFEVTKFMAQNDPTTHLHLYVPHDYVGQLIGRQGATIRYILERSNASVEVLPSQYAADISAYRVVSISGTPGQMTSAFSIMTKKFSAALLRNLQEQYGLEELRAESRDHKVVQVHFPVNLAGAIIGKAGHIIRGINSQTAAQLTVLPSEEAVNGQRVCEIKGFHASVLAALSEVLAKLRMAGCAHATLKIPVTPETSAAVSSRQLSLSRTSMSQISVEEGDSPAVIVAGGLTSVKHGYGLIQQLS